MQALKHRPQQRSAKRAVGMAKIKIEIGRRLATIAEILFVQNSYKKKFFKVQFKRLERSTKFVPRGIYIRQLEGVLLNSASPETGRRNAEDNREKQFSLDPAFD